MGDTTFWIRQLEEGDEEERQRAAAELWQRLGPELLQVARRRMNERVRRRESAEDVLQSAYKSFCIRHQRGEFELKNRDDLWAILVTITLRKVMNKIKYHHRAKRDYRRDQPAFDKTCESSDSLSSEPADFGHTPEQVMMFQEEITRRLESLPEPLRQVALWKIAGYTNQEIAGPEMLNCATRTVTRKLERIRLHWENEP